MARKKNNRSRSTGWAHTKQYPHKRHPAYYRKRNGDDIEYVTFTHANLAKIGKEQVPTKKLTTNIDYKNKGEQRYSHVVPRVYEGQRSALGKGTSTYKLDKADKPFIDSIFKTAPHFKTPKKKPRK